MNTSLRFQRMQDYIPNICMKEISFFLMLRKCLYFLRGNARRLFLDFLGVSPADYIRN